MTGIRKRGSSSESLVAEESCLGWVVPGQVNRQSKHTSSMLRVVDNSGVNKTLKRFWELESTGIAEIENAALSQRKNVLLLASIEDYTLMDITMRCNYHGKETLQD